MRINRRLWILSILAAAGIGLWTGGDLHRIALLLGVLFLVLSGGTAAWRGLRKGRREIFSPAVLVLSYLALGIGLRGTSVLLDGSTRLAAVIDPTEPAFDALMIRVFLLSLLGLAAFLAGDTLGGRLQAGRGAPARRPLPRRGVRASLLLGGILLVAGLGPLLARLGSAAFLRPGELAVDATAGVFWTFPLMFGGLYAIMLSIASRWSRGQHAGVPLLLGLTATAVLVYLSTSSKAALLTPVLMLLSLSHFLRRPVRLRTLLAAAGSFLVLLPLLYAYRAFGLSVLTGGRANLESIGSGWSLLLNRSYMSDSFAAVLHYTPQLYDYKLGLPWLEIFYFWIPRAIWPAKPYSQGFIFGTTYFSSSPLSGSSFFAVSWLGDAYMNFGLPGILGVFLGLGFLLRVAYDFLLSPRMGTGGAFLYSAALYHVVIGPEQSLSTFMTLTASTLVVAGLLLYVAERRPGGIESAESDGGS